MIKTLTLNTRFPPLGAFLTEASPAGVSVIVDIPKECRGFDFNLQVTLDIKLVIDLSKISALVFATWLVSRIRARNRKIEVHLNGQQIPEDESAAIEFVAKQIQDEEQNNQPKQ